MNHAFCQLLSALSLLVILAMALMSCGGGGGNGAVASTGRVVLTIHWPPTRAIPEATRSIKVVAKVLEPPDGPQVGEVVAQRPEGQATSQIVLDDLPSVKLLLTATAHESIDGTGDSIASGTAEVDVPEENSVAANINLEAEAPCVPPYSEIWLNGFPDPDTIVTGTTSASLNVRDLSMTVNVMSITASATVSAAQEGTTSQGTFRDFIIASSPTPDAVQFNVVFEITTSVGAESNASYAYHILVPGSNQIDLGGEFRAGAVISGEPPINREVTVPATVLPGFAAGIEIRLEHRTFAEGDHLSNSIRFKRFENVPAGVTLRTQSCEAWSGG